MAPEHWPVFKSQPHGFQVEQKQTTGLAFLPWVRAFRLKWGARPPQARFSAPSRKIRTHGDVPKFRAKPVRKVLAARDDQQRRCDRIPNFRTWVQTTKKAAPISRSGFEFSARIIFSSHCASLRWRPARRPNEQPARGKASSSHRSDRRGDRISRSRDRRRVRRKCPA